MGYGGEISADIQAGNPRYFGTAPIVRIARGLSRGAGGMASQRAHGTECPEVSGWREDRVRRVWRVSGRSRLAHPRAEAGFGRRGRRDADPRYDYRLR